MREMELWRDKVRHKVVGFDLCTKHDIQIQLRIRDRIQTSVCELRSLAIEYCSITLPAT